MKQTRIKQQSLWQKINAKFERLLGGHDDERYYYAKRCMDITLATLLFLSLLPVMAVIGLLVKLDSPGPMLFVQQRVGARRRRSEDGKVFWETQEFPFYKFRSMVQNADQSIHQEHIKAFVHGTLEASDVEGLEFKLKDDPRITRIGRILRQTSLDELPQLINVIKGEMSLVGPRPVPTYEVAEYEEWHRGRLNTLPGITGIWQVNGRSQVTCDQMVRMDLRYIRQASLWKDIKILLRTIPAVLAKDGAD